MRICIASVPFSSLIISCVFLLPVRAYLRRWRLNLVADHPCVFLLTARAYLHRQRPILVANHPLCVSAPSSSVSASMACKLVADHPCMLLLTVRTYLYRQCSILVAGRPCVALLTVCAYLHFQRLTACVVLLTFLAEAAPQHRRMEAELVPEQARLAALQEVHLVELAAKE